MKATVLSIQGWEEAITSLFMSKRTWTPELALDIRLITEAATDRYGKVYYEKYFPREEVKRFSPEVVSDIMEKTGKVRDSDALWTTFLDWTNALFKWGPTHITLLRYLDIAIMTEGMHRGGQDDIDSHARRFDNRIIRTSTRVTFMESERSEWYEDKIMTDKEAANIIGWHFPDWISYGGERWVKTTNGYVKEEYQNNKDVERGLYMLSLPSNFISKINLCEWGHVFKERYSEGGANPEVKVWAESITSQLHQWHPTLTRDFILSIKN